MLHQVRVPLIFNLLLLVCGAAITQGEILEPSVPCPEQENELPIPQSQITLETPSLEFPVGNNVPSRAAVMANAVTGLGSVPVTVLVLRDDHLLVFSRAVLDLGAPLDLGMESDPRLEEYFSYQLTEEQVIDFHLSCWADGLFDDVGTETTLVGDHWNTLMISNGDFRTLITSVHMGYPPDVYVSPSFDVGPLPQGETQESMLAAEDAGYRRSRESWHQAFSKIVNLIPEDESLWTELEGVDYRSFKWGICSSEE